MLTSCAHHIGGVRLTYGELMQRNIVTDAFHMVSQIGVQLFFVQSVCLADRDGFILVVGHRIRILVLHETFNLPPGCFRQRAGPAALFYRMGTGRRAIFRPQGNALQDRCQAEHVIG